MIDFKEKYSERATETVSVNIDKRRVVLLIIFFTYLLIISTIVLNISIMEKDRPMQFGLKDFVSINEVWIDKEGIPFEIANIEEYMDTTGEVTIYYQIPEDIGEGNSFVYRSKNTFTQISLQSCLLYKTDISENALYNKSPGTRWNIVNIPSSAAGEYLEMKISLAYEDQRSKVDNMYLGDGIAIVLFIINSKGIAMATCLLLLFVGIFLIIIDIALSFGHKGRARGVLHLGVIAVLISIWCMIETNIMQLFVRDARVLQVINNTIMLIGTLDLFLYIDYCFQVFQYRIIRWLCYIDAIYIGFCIFSKLAGGPDFHETLLGAQIYYAIVSMVLIFSVISESRQLRGSTKKPVEHTLKLIGVAILGVALFLEFLRFLQADVMDRAFLTRFGMLGFIICFGASNLVTFLQLSKQGERVEFVSKLAYLDGLTNLGNRTAFFEKLHYYVDNPPSQLGFVVLDVNNLKTVNDQLGHFIGDELIVSSANMIQNTFGQYGNAYRVGGDEFCVLIQEDNSQHCYEKAKVMFSQAIQKQNEDSRFEYNISIAHGFAVCHDITEESTQKTYCEADKRMYQNKEKLKMES